MFAKLPLIAAVCLLAAVPSFGTPLPACATQDLAAYMGLADGCVVGDLIFSDFDYQIGVLKGSPTLIQPDHVTVTPFTDDVSNGLSFGGNWTAASGQEVDYRLFYNVSTLSGQAEISGDHLAMEGAREGPNTVASLDDFLCPGSEIGLAACGYPPRGVHFYERLTPFPTGSSDFMAFPAVSTAGILKDIFVYAPMTGNANVSMASNGFSTPEPGTLYLGVAGALVLLLRRRA